MVQGIRQQTSIINFQRPQTYIRYVFARHYVFSFSFAKQELLTSIERDPKIAPYKVKIRTRPKESIAIGGDGESHRAAAHKSLDTVSTGIAPEQMTTARN